MLGFRSQKLNEPLNTIYTTFVATVMLCSTQLRVKIWNEKPWPISKPYPIYVLGGRDSVVGIANRYRLDGPGGKGEGEIFGIRQDRP